MRANFTGSARVPKGIRVWAILALLLPGPRPAISSPVAPVDSNALLRGIASDWRDRHEVVVAARYRVIGKVRFMRGCFNYLDRADLPKGTSGDVPAGDEEFDVDQTILLDLRAGRARKEYTQHSFRPDDLSFIHFRKANVFDGTTTRERRLDIADREELERAGEFPIEMVLPTETFNSFFFDYDDYGVLCAHGIVPRNFNIPVGAIGAAPTFDGYGLHGRAVKDGSEALVLRTESNASAHGSYAEMWVDPNRRGAVVQWTTYSEGRERVRIEIKYRETAHGPWPESWRVTRFAFDEPRVESIRNLNVALVDFEPAVNLDDFREEIEPGMIILDAVAHQAYKYLGPDVPRIPYEDLVRRAKPQRGKSAGHSSAMWAAAAAGSLLLLVASGYLLRVRRSRSNAIADQ